MPRMVKYGLAVLAALTLYGLYSFLPTYAYNPGGLKSIRSVGTSVGLPLMVGTSSTVGPTVITAHGTGVPDNSSNITYYQSDSPTYWQYTKVTVNDTMRQYIVWQYSATFTDLSGNGNDATPSFRTTSSDADVSASLLNFGPASEAEIGTFTVVTELEDIIGENATAMSQLYSELDVTHIPGGEGINQILDAGGMPRAMWWFPTVFIGIAIVGLVFYGATRLRGATGSVLMAAVVMEILLVVIGIMNPIPLWPALLFPIWAGAIIVSQKHYTWG